MHCCPIYKEGHPYRCAKFLGGKNRVDIILLLHLILSAQDPTLVDAIIVSLGAWGDPGNMELHVAIAAIGFISALHAFLEDQAAFLNILSTLVAAAKTAEMPPGGMARGRPALTQSLFAEIARGTRIISRLGARTCDWGPKWPGHGYWSIRMFNFRTYLSDFGIPIAISHGILDSIWHEK
jgi:hypothetical protein